MKDIKENKEGEMGITEALYRKREEMERRRKGLEEVRY